jgi:hypothetical protein
MKALPNIPIVNDAQVDFGIKLGVNLRGCTVTVAAALIEDAIDLDFWGKELARPTPKQIALAATFGHDISSSSRRVGDAVIGDLMEQLNPDAIAREQLTAGTVVINVHDPIGMQHTISSITPDGTVYYRGGNGQRAWARSLRRAPSTEAGADAGQISD